METKRREKIVGITAVACLCLLAADRLVVSPLYAFWSAREERIENLSKSLRNGDLLIKRESDIRSRWDEMRRNGLASETSVAEESVLNSVNRWGSESGLTITSIRPKWESGGDEFSEYKLRVVGTGNMESISRFVYEAERSQTALRVEEVGIAAGDDRGDNLTLDVRLSGLSPMETEE